MLFAHMIGFCHASKFLSVLGIIIFLCNCFLTCQENVTEEETCSAHYWMFVLLGLQPHCLKNCLSCCSFGFAFIKFLILNVTKYWFQGYLSVSEFVTEFEGNTSHITTSVLFFCILRFFHSIATSSLKQGKFM